LKLSGAIRRFSRSWRFRFREDARNDEWAPDLSCSFFNGVSSCADVFLLILKQEPTRHLPPPARPGPAKRYYRWPVVRWHKPKQSVASGVIGTHIGYRPGRRPVSKMQHFVALPAGRGLAWAH
jgi:hypothetical protein